MKTHLIKFSDDTYEDLARLAAMLNCSREQLISGLIRSGLTQASINTDYKGRPLLDVASFRLSWFMQRKRK